MSKAVNFFNLLFDTDGAPYETRTRVSGVRGQRPGPLDEGSE